MQRRVDITVPPEQTDELLGEIRRLDGLLSLRVQRGISEQPAGDLITVEALIRPHLALIALLERRGIGQSNSSSVSISGSGVVISPTIKEALGREGNLSSWEQMQSVIAETSNMTGYALTAMFSAGVIVAVGITTGALHVAVGAFIIAPGFEPVVRFPLGIVARSPAWKRGIVDTLKGYLALILGAFLAALLMRSITPPLLSGSTAYFPVEPLVSYWTSLSMPSALVAVTGGLVGAILVATDRAVLTGGVMVALALVPTATMVGIALAAGDLVLATHALGRFLAEVGFVLVGSTLVWLWLRAREQSRPSML